MNGKWIKMAGLAAAATLTAGAIFAGVAAAQTPQPQSPGYGPGRGTGLMQAGVMQRGRGMMQGGQPGTGPQTGPARGGMWGGPQNSLVAVAAEKLGLSQSELVTQLGGGKNIAEVAAAKGVAPASIVDAFVAQRAEQLKTAVTAGRLTQADADTMLATMRAQVTTQLSQPFAPRGPGMARGSGAPIDDDNDGVCDHAEALQPGAGAPAAPRGPMNGRGPRR